MALNIENATIGFDENNVEKSLNNLNVRCIGETIDLMKSSYMNLQTAVDAAWVGASADQFKKNVLSDINVISESLQETYEILRSEMYQVVNEMAAVDAELVKAREQ